MAILENLNASREIARTIFDRVLVGIDGSPESLEAARQAALLQSAQGSLTLLAAWNLAPPLVTPMFAQPRYEIDEELARVPAEHALRLAREQTPSGTEMIVRGFPAHALVDEIERGQATLVAVGSHGQDRAEGILFGSTATELVHRAPCSVLIARGAGQWLPRRIAVGVDGSPHSAVAYAAATHLCERFDGDLTVVVAEGGKAIDVAAVSLIAGDGFHVIPEEPVRVLAAAAADADLIVLGSRGLHGLKALGSVSERVAHRAGCSTLIVRAS